MSVTAAASGTVTRSFNQTGFMFVAIGLAFLFFITARGDLAKWLGAFGLAGGTAGTATPSASAAGASGLSGVPAVGLQPLPALPGLLGGG